MKCERCHQDTAEYVVGFFQVCKRCDKPEALRIPEPCPDDGWLDLEWGDQKTPVAARRYQCMNCSLLHYSTPTAVANGARCTHCKGMLMVSYP